MTGPKDGLFRRALRRFTLGGGPLKRRSDRIQVIGRVVVALSFLLAPPLAVAAATATTAHLQSVADAESADRSRTRVVVLEDAAAPPGTGTTEYADPPVQVRATWALPDGTSRTGIALVPPRTPAGTAVPVWVDDEGNLTRAPLDRAAIGVTANVTALVPLLGLPLVTWTLYACLCFYLDVRRERRWETDWAAVEPDWNSRLL